MKAKLKRDLKCFLEVDKLVYKRKTTGNLVGYVLDLEVKEGFYRKVLEESLESVMERYKEQK